MDFVNTKKKILNMDCGFTSKEADKIIKLALNKKYKCNSIKDLDRIIQDIILPNFN